MIKKTTPTLSDFSGQNDQDQQFLVLRQALLQRIGLVETQLQQRFHAPRPWKFLQADLVLRETGDVIDLVFEHPAPNDRRFILMDLSVPHLQKGQKFALDVKTRQYVREQNIPLSRVKKAILLIRRDQDPPSTSSSRLHCPIVELSWAVVMGEEQEPTQESEADFPAEEPEVSLPAPVFSQDLLTALQQAIVQECLSTMHKRRNKYIRKGLWRWIEREILDPNLHFFLIILSSIYQGKTSEVLSRKFKTVESFCNSPDVVIEAIFSEETGLAPEIVKNADRHRKAVRKFLECFAQTPPFEYLRTLFLKDFRTSRDGTRSRTTVFNTLRELMVRCGFAGEKETQYPLEIIDELGVFQGLLMGDYTHLRVENATKKLQHLVPQHTWTPENIYRLRDDLARILHLPPSEFNLNAFLPQAFVHRMPNGKVAPEANPLQTATPIQRPLPLLDTQDSFPGPEEPPPPSRSAPPEPGVLEASSQQPPPPVTRPKESRPSRSPSSRSPRGSPRSAPPAAVDPGPSPTPVEATAPGTTGPSPLTPPAAAPGLPHTPPAAGVLPAVPVIPPPPLITGLLGTIPTPAPLPVREPDPVRSPGATSGQNRQPEEAHQQGARPPSPPRPGFRPSGPPQPTTQPPRPPLAQPPRPIAPTEDEACHRYFESFGGQLEEDQDSLRFAIEFARNRPAPPKPPVAETDFPVEDGPPPSKSAINAGARRPVFRQHSSPSDVPPTREGGAPNKKRHQRRRSGKSKNRPRPPMYPRG